LTRRRHKSCRRNDAAAADQRRAFSTQVRVVDPEVHAFDVRLMEDADTENQTLEQRAHIVQLASVFSILLWPSSYCCRRSGPAIAGSRQAAGHPVLIAQIDDVASGNSIVVGAGACNPMVMLARWRRRQQHDRAKFRTHATRFLSAKGPD